MIKRAIEERIHNALAKKKVVTIMGPRQVGKSTLADAIIPEDAKVLEINGDNADVQTMFVNVDESKMKVLIGNKNFLFVDEAQKIENVGNMLKCIGDKKRLEILQRLNREPQFGGELAESMGMDPGHTSRILTQMHAYGFLQEEKDRLRLYYRPDREVIHNFLELVEATIFSQ